MITIVILFSLVACLVGSLVISKNIRLIEYASNRSRSEFSQVLFTILGSLVGGWMFFGLCAVGYEAGVAGFAIGIGYCIGLVILGKSIPRIKKAMVEENCDTLDDLIGSRYGGNAQLCVTIINLVLFLAILAAQFIAMSSFLNVFTEINGQWSFYVAVLVVLIYTAMAGFKGVIFTDIWQFYILSVSAIVIFSFLTFNVDWNALQAIDPTYLNGTGYGIGFLFGVLVLFPASLLVRTDLWQRIAAAKSIKDAQRAFFISAPILLVFYILLTSIGIYGFVALGEGVQADTSGFVLFLNIIRSSTDATLSFGANIFLSVLALGVFAALLSTADTNLNVVSVAVSKIVKRNSWEQYELITIDKFRGVPSGLESTILRTVRIITIILGIVALAVAKIIPDIVNLIVIGASSVMVFLPSVYMTLFKKARKPLPTIASIIGGIIVLIPLLLIAPKMAFLPATLTSIIVYFVFHLYGKTKIIVNEVRE